MTDTSGDSIGDPDHTIIPGDTLKKILEYLGVSTEEVPGLTTEVVEGIIAGKEAISPKIADILEKVTGAPASVWNDLERNCAVRFEKHGGLNPDEESKDMSNLSFEDLREKNVARCVAVYHPLDSWSPTDWGCALAGEVGEACNILKKHKRGDAGPHFRRDLSDELADVVIYADLLAARCGIELGEAVKFKFNLVSERKGSSIKL